jgi:hypothetical protein
MPLTLRIIWRTQKDPQVCPICKALEDYTWILEVGDPFPKQLIHPTYGPVYNTRPAADDSLVKEEKGHLCRCTLKYEFDLSCDDRETTNTSNKQPNKQLVEQQ